jgi:hypothetical protein
MTKTMGSGLNMDLLFLQTDWFLDLKMYVNGIIFQFGLTAFVFGLWDLEPVSADIFATAAPGHHVVRNGPGTLCRVAAAATACCFPCRQDIT